MANDGMKGRGRALEEEWARRQQAEAIEKLKKDAGKSDCTGDKAKCKAAGACKCKTNAPCKSKCGC